MSLQLNQFRNVSLLILFITLFYSCKIGKNQTCSCTASSVWASCSVTCQYKNGICLATCTSPSLMAGLVGSMPTCGCSAGGGGTIHSDGANTAKLFIAKKNVKQMDLIITVLEEDGGASNLIEEIKELQSLEGEKVAPVVIENKVKSIGGQMKELKPSTLKKIEKLVEKI